MQELAYFMPSNSLICNNGIGHERIANIHFEVRNNFNKHLNIQKIFFAPISLLILQLTSSTITFSMIFLWYLQKNTQNNLAV
ncbi:MAG: hypothetical protein ACI9RO_000277 [Alteromonas macleodii]|jgi:hypothetical protein